MLSNFKMLIITSGLAIGLLVGCDNEEITRYRVERLDPPKPRTKSQTAKSGQRLLGVILPRGEKTWFVKFTGPPEQIDQQKEAFARFILSIHFEADQEMAWTVPDGWRELPPTSLRYATFQLGPKDQPLELTVTSLGSEAAAVLPNVNRWRGQLGLPPVDEMELGQCTTEMKLAGVPATLVDITGRGGSEGAMSPPFAGGPAAPPAASGRASGRPSLTYDTPDGWKELPNPGSMRVAAFQVKDGDKQAEVTIIPLGRQAGGVLANVNRWRGQIGLGPIGEDELRRDLSEIELAGSTGTFIDIVGAESSGTERQRILAVMAVRGEQTWFFKMTGPADVIEKQKAAFGTFVRSVQFSLGN